jgi:hypothetical protein
LGGGLTLLDPCSAGSDDGDMMPSSCELDQSTVSGVDGDIIVQETLKMNQVRYGDGADHVTETDDSEESIVDDILKRHFDWDERRVC